MANEINSSISISVNFGSGQSIGGDSNTYSDLTGNCIGIELDIPTSATAIDFGSVDGTPDPVIFVFIKNLDNTNYVEVDNSNTFTNFPQKLLPGRAIYLIPESLPIYAKANTATCKIFVCAAD